MANLMGYWHFKGFKNEGWRVARSHLDSLDQLCSGLTEYSGLPYHLTSVSRRSKQTVCRYQDSFH